MTRFSILDEVSESPAVIDLQSEGRRVACTLRFDPQKGIELRLLDTVKTLRWGHDSSSRFDVLHGQLINGALFTLVNVVLTGVNAGGGQIAEPRFTAEHLLVGVWLERQDDHAFSEVSVTTTCMNAWFGAPPPLGNTEQLSPVENRRRFMVTCDHAPRFGCSPVSDGPSLLSEQVMWTSTDEPWKTSLRSEFHMHVIPRRRISVSDVQKELFGFQSLMSLLCGSQVFFTKVKLKISDSGEDHDALPDWAAYFSHFARPVGGVVELRRDEVLLPLSRLRGSLPAIWVKWLQQREAYRSAVELFVSTEVLGGQLAQFRLLAIMQALETLHRERYGGTYLPDQEYQHVAVSLKSSIPSHIAQRLRQSLESRIKYGNEYSLRTRLQDMGAVLPGGLNGRIATMLHPRLKRFLQQSVDTRNYFTHHSSELRSIAFAGVKLQLSIRVLRWFFAAVILSDLGVPEDQLAHALSRSRSLANARDGLASL